MAYGIKFELFFTDRNSRKLKVEILQKDFVATGVKWEDITTNFEATENLWNDQTSSITPLIGTQQPVIIEWDGDDDIYSPIIGSRCILNLFVTNQTYYDDFYNADEREYKVKVLYYTPTGNNWEDEDPQWEQFDANYEAGFGDDLFYQPLWEGFLVVDRFQEQILSKPFPIKLEAIDGLGTLEGFDAPFDPQDTNVNQNLFYSLKEILKLTGHEHPIYIANDTRKVGGATNDTIFHDIEVNKYGLMTKNLIFRNAKEVLETILKATNSRIYQSFARWYVVNNSSLIDNRVNQLSLAPVGDDTAIEPAIPTDPTEVVLSPVVEIEHSGGTGSTASVQEGTAFFFNVQNSGGPIETFTWTLPDLSTESGTGPNPTLTFVSTNAMNGQTVEISATNATGTDTDSVTLAVTTPQTPTDPTDVGGFFTFNVNQDNLTNATASPESASIPFAASEVGDAYEFNLLLTPNPAFNFGSINDVSVTGVSGTVTKFIGPNYQGINGIRINIVGTLPSGGKTETIVLTGGIPDQTFYNVNLTFDNNTTNTDLYLNDSPSPYNLATDPTLVLRIPTGDTFTQKLRFVAKSGFSFNFVNNIETVFNSGEDVIHTIDLINASDSLSGQREIVVIVTPRNTSLKVGTPDATITDTLTLTGTPSQFIAATSLNVANAFPTGTASFSSISIPKQAGYVTLASLLQQTGGSNLGNGWVALVLYSFSPTANLRPVFRPTVEVTELGFLSNIRNWKSNNKAYAFDATNIDAAYTQIHFDTTQFDIHWVVAIYGYGPDGVVENSTPPYYGALSKFGLFQE